MRKLFTLLSIAAFTNLSFGQSNIAVGATCPNFTVTDVDGTSHTLYDLCDSGQYVMIDFFAYWCGPCMQTAPTIHDFYTKYGCNQGDVFVLGIESDPNSTLANLQSFKNSAGLPSNSFPNVLGSQGGSTVRNTYGIAAFPTIVLIGPDRKMLNNDIYPLNDLQMLEKAFPAGSILEMNRLNQDPNNIENNLDIFPNPVSDILNVVKKNIQNVSIYDATGKTIMTTAYNNIDQIEIDVTDFENGLYIITVATANGVINSRFIKK